MSRYWLRVVFSPLFQLCWRNAIEQTLKSVRAIPWPPAWSGGVPRPPPVIITLLNNIKIRVIAQTNRCSSGRLLQWIAAKFFEAQRWAFRGVSPVWVWTPPTSKNIFGNFLLKCHDNDCGSFLAHHFNSVEGTRLTRRWNLSKHCLAVVARSPRLLQWKTGKTAKLFWSPTLGLSRGVTGRGVGDPPPHARK